MTETALIAATLGLTAPWEIKAITFADTERRMDITIDFYHGGTFRCPRCGAHAHVSESVQEIWHRENFFHYTAYLHVRVPRLACEKECGTSNAVLPWAKPNSLFTLIPLALGV